MERQKKCRTSSELQIDQLLELAEYLSGKEASWRLAQAKVAAQSHNHALLHGNCNSSGHVDSAMGMKTAGKDSCQGQVESKRCVVGNAVAEAGKLQHPCATDMQSQSEPAMQPSVQPRASMSSLSARGKEAARVDWTGESAFDMKAAVQEQQAIPCTVSNSHANSDTTSSIKHDLEAQKETLFTHQKHQQPSDVNEKACGALNTGSENQKPNPKRSESQAQACTTSKNLRPASFWAPLFDNKERNFFSGDIKVCGRSLCAH
jgi:uncharacterized protein YvpB